MFAARFLVGIALFLTIQFIFMVLYNKQIQPKRRIRRQKQAQMKIIIVGDGKVGFTLSEHLSREGHDITIIDNRNDVLQKTIESLDVITIRGNGASSSVLKKAEVNKADLLIAATSSDEVNMICCLMGKKLGVKKTIARIRNPEYSEQLAMMENEMGLSMVVNPELATAMEISHLISFPSAINIGIFADDRVYLIEFKVKADNPMAGLSISAIQEKYSSNILICAVYRDSRIYIPNGDFIIKAGDHIHIVGDYESIDEHLKALGYREKKTRQVMIVGGGLITYYLSHILIDYGIEVKIIEKKKGKCEELCESIPQALLIYGDGTEKQLLDSERIDSTDAFIALTDVDEENLIMSMYAAYKNVPKVITKINRLEYADVIRQAGIDRVISPKYITANHIVRYVRGMQNLQGSRIKTLYRIMGKSAEVVEFVATSSTKHLGTPLAQIPLRKNILITTIVRDDDIIIPKGKDCFLEGDTVIVVTTMKQLEDLNEIFEK